MDDSVTVQADKFINYLAEKLPEMFIKLQTEKPSSISHPTVNTSAISNNEIAKQKQLLSNVLHDYLKTTSQIQASTQVKEENKNDRKSYTSFCSTSTNT